VRSIHGGQIDFGDVLDSQRSPLSFEDQPARSEGTVSSNLVRLFKALGGGWKPEAGREVAKNVSVNPT
jgi:outer membrane protein TolC